MSTNFPTSLDSLTNPTGADPLNSPNHADQHINANDAIEAIQAKVGADSSAVTTSHDYKLSGVTGSDKAVSKTGTETLTNKTITAPIITNPTITVDTVSEFTSTNGVTIDGLNIKDSKITTANVVDSDQYTDSSIDTAHIADDQVTPAKWTNPYCFWVNRTADQTGVGSGAFVKVEFNNELFDTNSNYDAVTNYTYTAPVSGIYFFTSTVEFENLDASVYAYIRIRYNDGSDKTAVQTRNKSTSTANDEVAMSASCYISLSASDTVWVEAQHDSAGNETINSSGIQCMFGGHLVHAT